MNCEQLSLFEPLVLESADYLLSMINDPKKPRWFTQYWFKEKGLYVFIAADKDKNFIFNVLDDNGNIPPGFVANWRIWPHVKHELEKHNPYERTPNLRGKEKNLSR